MNAIINQECKVTGSTQNEKKPKQGKDIKIGIYGLKNQITGEWYIGQSKNILDRWKAYKRLKCKNQTRLYRAINKYGYDAFEKIILEECGASMLNQKEAYWIKHYNSMKNGYNLTEGGDHTTLSEETRKKIGQKSKGRKHSPETIEKIKRARANQCSTPMDPAHLEKLRQISINRVVSQETREKMRLAHLGKKHSETTKQKMRDAR